MIVCEMDYNSVSKDGKRLQLVVQGLGIFPVFSGIEPVTDIAECAYKKMLRYQWAPIRSLMHPQVV